MWSAFRNRSVVDASVARLPPQMLNPDLFIEAIVRLFGRALPLGIDRVGAMRNVLPESNALFAAYCAVNVTSLRALMETQ